MRDRLPVAQERRDRHRVPALALAAQADKAQVREVTARFITANEMMVEEGLEEGTRVVLDGQLNLAAGVPVTERRPDGSPAAGGPETK